MDPKNTDDGAEKASGNISLAELGSRISKGRKAQRPDPGKPAAKPESDDAGAAAPTSEQADADATEQPDLSQSADEESSAAPTATEGGGETETETDDQSDDDASNDGKKAHQKMQKRIDRLTAQRETLREESEELKGRLESENTELRERLARYETAEPKNDPVHKAVTGSREVQEIDGQVTAYESFVDWAAENPEGGIWAEDGKEHNLDAESVKSLRRTAERELRRLMSRRESKLESLRNQFETKRAAAHAEALSLYPWMRNKASPEFQEALNILRERPELLQVADFELRVGREVAGLRLEREAQKKAKGTNGSKPKGSSTPTPVVTHSAAAAPRSGSGQASGKSEEVRAAEDTFKQTGRASDLGNLLAQRKRAREAPAN